MLRWRLKTKWAGRPRETMPRQARLGEDRVVVNVSWTGDTPPGRRYDLAPRGKVHAPNAFRARDHSAGHGGMSPIETDRTGGGSFVGGNVSWTGDRGDADVLSALDQRPNESATPDSPNGAPFQSTSIRDIPPWPDASISSPKCAANDNPIPAARDIGFGRGVCPTSNSRYHQVPLPAPRPL